MRANFTPFAALGMAGLMLAATPALARQITTSSVLPPDVPAPTTTPLGTPATPGDTVATTNAPIGRVGPGVTSARAVNPAPGAAVEQLAKTRLTGAKRRQAMAEITSIKAELATQVARHGDLRDWDRENLNHRLNQLEAQVGLGPQGQGA
jgi:hypothetical protein